MKRDQLIVALDLPGAKEARKLVNALGDDVIFYKVGLRLFTQEGPQFILWLKKKGKKVFLDLKFHDIPNTVAQAVESAVRLGVDLLTVHASGGPEMLGAAVNSARKASKAFQKKRPQIFAVTLLTSLKNLNYLGLKGEASEQVRLLAGMACQSGVDGVVCSPEEIGILKKKFGKSMKLLSPGIRWEARPGDDQKRTSSPSQALRAGADYIVVGRPILLAPKPKEAVQILFSQCHLR